MKEALADAAGRQRVERGGEARRRGGDALCAAAVAGRRHAARE